MAFSIQCICGNTFDVPAGRAGAKLACSCGRTLAVPPLSELQRAAAAGRVCPAEEFRERAASGDSAGEEMPREFFMILAPDHVIAQRVHQEAFVHFVAAFDRTLKSFVRKTETQPGVDVQIGYAMFPDDRRLIDLQIRPEIMQPHILAELKMELEALRQPPVEGGPVSFCCRTMLWGGAAQLHPPFLFPFSRQFTRRAGSFDQLLLEAAGLSADQREATGGDPERGSARANGLRSLLRRAKRWLGRTPVPSASSPGARRQRPLQRNRNRRRSPGPPIPNAAIRSKN